MLYLHVSQALTTHHVETETLFCLVPITENKYFFQLKNSERITLLCVNSSHTHNNQLQI